MGNGHFKCNDCAEVDNFQEQYETMQATNTISYQMIYQIKQNDLKEEHFDKAQTQIPDKDIAIRIIDIPIYYQKILKKNNIDITLKVIDFFKSGFNLQESLTSFFVSNYSLEYEQERMMEDFEEDLKLAQNYLDIFEYSNGALYTGQFKNGKRHGAGKMIFTNGTIYIGYFYENQQSIYGKLINEKGDKYEGQFRNGMIEGYGEYVGKEGNYYKGHWQNEQMEGYGEEMTLEGHFIQGNYIKGKVQGIAKCFFRDGSKYVGEFQMGQFMGKGLYQWSDGREYNGQWQLNFIHGEGIFKWPDGSQFIGVYNLNIKQKGTIIFSNGISIYGNYLNGHLNGDVFIYHPIANFRRAHFLNGKFNKYYEEELKEKFKIYNDKVYQDRIKEIQ